MTQPPWSRRPGALHRRSADVSSHPLATKSLPVTPLPLNRYSVSITPAIIICRRELNDRRGEFRRMRRNAAKIIADGQPVAWLGANFWSRTGGPLMWRNYDPAVVSRALRGLRDHRLP